MNNRQFCFCSVKIPTSLHKFQIEQLTSVKLNFKLLPRFPPHDAHQPIASDAKFDAVRF